MLIPYLSPFQVSSCILYWQTTSKKKSIFIFVSECNERLQTSYPPTIRYAIICKTSNKNEPVLVAFLVRLFPSYNV